MAYLSLAKIPFLLLSSACIQVSATPPTPHTKHDSEERTRYSRDHAIRELLPMPFGWGQIAFKSAGHIINALEIMAILVSTYQRSIQHSSLSWLLEDCRLARAGAQVYSSPGFVLGLCLCLLGAGLRAWCYRHMGRHFTFELTIQRDHKLITTGPYALVRHPSYTGMFIFSVGSFLCLFGPGSYWSVSRMWGCSSGWVLGGFYVGYRVYVNMVLFARVVKEDEVLRKEFKEGWERWSLQTPYRLIPLFY